MNAEEKIAHIQIILREMQVQLAKVYETGKHKEDTLLALNDDLKRLGIMVDTIDMIDDVIWEEDCK